MACGEARRHSISPAGDRGATHWEYQKQASGLLWRPPDLDLLAEYCLRARADMTNLEMRFYKASRDQHKKSRILRQTAIAALACLAVLAAGSAVYAARLARTFAEERDRSSITQSRFLANLSAREVAAGNPGTGVLVALGGLPADLSHPDRPYVPETEIALYGAVKDYEESHFVFTGHDGPVRSAAFDQEGKRVITAGDDMTARIWDALSGKIIKTLNGHSDRLVSAVFSPDGRRAATASY